MLLPRQVARRLQGQALAVEVLVGSLAVALAAAVARQSPACKYKSQKKHKQAQYCKYIHNNTVSYSTAPNVLCAQITI